MGSAYEFGPRLRYDFNDVLAADGSYRMKWVTFATPTDYALFSTASSSISSGSSDAACVAKRRRSARRSICQGGT